jgi:hypothetical protein
MNTRAAYAAWWEAHEEAGAQQTMADALRHRSDTGGHVPCDRDEHSDVLPGTPGPGTEPA